MIFFKVNNSIPHTGAIDCDIFEGVCWEDNKMDAQSRKATFRARVKETAQKSDNRIDSPLVRYNELDQAVCKVCNVVIKSESLWPTHQASRKHNEAVEILKARAAKSATRDNIKPTHTGAVNVETQSISSVPSGTRLSSNLPPNFFDEPEAKRQNRGSTSTGNIEDDNKTAGSTAPQEDTVYSITSLQALKGKTPGAAALKETGVPKNEKGGLADNIDMKGRESGNVSSFHTSEVFNQKEKSEGNQVKGSLPEGFFDNKDADLRARGLEPIKYDIKDELKEFQKTIQEDLQEVDYRLEEEEFDAAEVREEMELIAQRTYVERVEMLKKKQQEISIAKASAEVKSPSYMGADSSDVSSSDEEIDEDYLIDWRAKHF